MSPTFTIADWAVCALLLLLAAGIAVWTGRRSQSSDGFLLADRSLGWAVLAPALALGGLTTLVLLTAPLDGYDAGLRMLLPAICLWAAVPLALLFAVPLYAQLELDSAGEYIELRFDPATRAWFVAMQMLVQLVWLAGMLALAPRVFGFGSAAYLPAFALIVALGALATGYVFVGGLRGGTWAALLQLALALAAVGVLLAVASASFPEGFGRVWSAAEASSRTTIADLQSPTGAWDGWSAAPLFILAGLYFLLIDQPMLQRLFAARSQLEMTYGVLTGSLLASVAISLAALVGVALFAVYQQHAQTDIPPQWVARFALDPQTGQPMGDADTIIDEDSIDRLIERGALLDPNTAAPLTSSEGLVRPDGRVIVDRLATRATRRQGGERLLRAGRDRVAGHFVEGRVRAGVRGIVLAGLAGAALSAVAFGLIAMTTLVVIDLHRRFGGAERWLARRTGKAPAELDQADELQLARPVVLLLGAAVTLAALLLTGIDNLPAFLLAWLGVFAGPMLALFLLGLFTRRATGLAGRLALLAGMAAGACAAMGPMLAEFSGIAALWPLPVLGAGGPMIVGTGVALLAGYVLSFALGKRMSRRELSGLVVGAGPLGVLREAEEPLAGLSALEAEARRPPRRPSPWR